MLHARSMINPPRPTYVDNSRGRFVGVTRSRTKRNPFAIQGRSASSRSAKSITVMLCSGTRTCFNSIGRVARATTPKPVITTLPSNLVIAISLLFLRGFPHGKSGRRGAAAELNGCLERLIVVLPCSLPVAPSPTGQLSHINLSTLFTEP